MENGARGRRFRFEDAFAYLRRAGAAFFTALAGGFRGAAFFAAFFAAFLAAGFAAVLLVAFLAGAFFVAGVFAGATVLVAMSIAAYIASRIVLAIALIASVIVAAGFTTGSLTVVAGGAAASSLMSHSFSNSACVGTVPWDTRWRRAATESRTIFSTTSRGRRFRSENLM